jgi:hypothetical protein
MYTLSRAAVVSTQYDDISCGPRLVGFAWILAFQCLIMVLPTLKLLHLFGVDDWSWRWITIPFWGPSVLLALLLTVEQLTGFRKAATQVGLSY